jgi:anthranilate synthase
LVAPPSRRRLFAYLTIAQRDRPGPAVAALSGTGGRGPDREAEVDPSFHETGQVEFVTAGGVRVTRTVQRFDPGRMAGLAAAADRRRGGVLSSGMEYPGRYSRWHMAYLDPCIEVVARDRTIAARALNERGQVLLPVFDAAFRLVGTVPPGTGADQAPGPAAPPEVVVHIPEPTGVLPEEDRTRRPTLFTALRQVIAALRSNDANLGLYGAFGYDLAFQFEPVTLRKQRPAGQRDLVLHLPDELYMVDRKRETALRYSYDFEVGGPGGGRTHGLPRITPPTPRAGAGMGADGGPVRIPPRPAVGSYARVVAAARQRFARGDLFEVVPSQVFHHECASPAAFYERLRGRNPAPFEFLFNLGEGEYLVGASPEMFVRVAGDRVETCPISGTIERGADPLGDAANIRLLLNSAKEESELTMCTDVDRNDKARICVPGSVQVIGRRQIEMYSRVIHTVDHIEGRLRPGCDALDAFLSHMWAVTVTGAPKTWAMQFIEDHEAAPRAWYGGAVGKIGFDGSLNTGLSLRTAHIVGGVAAVRAGATLLYDSDPDAEERETELKARALLETLALVAESGQAAAGRAGDPASPAGHPGADRLAQAAPGGGAALPGDGITVLLVDHQDSFVHTLADYFRQQGAQVTTLRAGFDPSLLDEIGPDLVVLSPGPGRPADFGCDALLKELDARDLAAFGVCLGLQAMVEHAGGTLSLLDRPVHGKPGSVRQCLRGGAAAAGPAATSAAASVFPAAGSATVGSATVGSATVGSATVMPGAELPGTGLLAGLPAEFTAARYHSLHVTSAQVRGGFAVTAVTPDGAVMAIEDNGAGRWAVQFHPESILTAAGGAGHQVIANVLRMCRARR